MKQRGKAQSGSGKRKAESTQPGGSTPNRNRVLLLGAILTLALIVWAAPQLYRQWQAHLPTGQLAEYCQGHPEDRSAAQILVTRYLKEREPAEALAAAARTLEKDPENPPLWLLRSQAEYELGKLGAAYGSLQVAMPYLQQSAEAHWRLGKLLQRRGDDVGMLREWRRAIALDKNHLGVNLDLARDEVIHLHYTPALTYLNRVLRQEPNNQEALVLRASVRQNSGDLPGAEQDARGVVRIAPRDASAWQALGEVLRLKATPPALVEAEQCYRKALGLSPDPWSINQELGQLLFTQGRYAEAASALSASLKNHDLNPIPYPTLMQCYLRLGRRAEIAPLQAKYRKIEEIDLSTAPLEYTVEAMPENTAARLRLARLYRKYGRTDMALVQLDAVLKLNANLPEALRLQNEWKPAHP